ncbi:MAG: UDP-glucose 4-epimerase GalE [Pseudomonadota bacterium]|jgi:UDP-glucose 4-epimerase
MVLLTGAAGYIGSVTAKKFLESGHDVLVVDNLSTGFRDSVPNGCQFAHGNVLDTYFLESLMKSHKIEAVVHFAAKLIVPESVRQPAEYYENNVGGMISLMKACRSAGVEKVVFSSTAAVYGNCPAGLTGLITEGDSISPLNPYGTSKFMSEQILRDSEIAYGIKNVCLRYFNVAGADIQNKIGQRTMNATHLIKVAAEAACRKRDAVSVFGTDYSTKDGTGVRDYIHVEDLADLHVLSLNYLKKSGTSNVFNCGYGSGASVLQVLDTMERVSGQKIQRKLEPRREGDADRLVADPSKIKKTLNWEPKRADLEKICESAYLWERTQL